MDGSEIGTWLLILSAPFWLASILGMVLRKWLLKYPTLYGTLGSGFQIGFLLSIVGLGLRYWEGRYDSLYFRFVLIPMMLVLIPAMVYLIFIFRRALIKQCQDLYPKSI